MLLAIQQLQAIQGRNLGSPAAGNSPECVTSMNLSSTLRPFRKSPGLTFAERGFSHKWYLMESSRARLLPKNPQNNSKHFPGDFTTTHSDADHPSREKKIIRIFNVTLLVQGEAISSGPFTRGVAEIPAHTFTSILVVLVGPQTHTLHLPSLKNSE